MYNQDYKNIETDIVSLIDRRMYWVTPYRWIHSFIKRSRRFSNRILFSEEETLIIAQNRIRFHDAEPSWFFKKLSLWWVRTTGRKIKEKPFVVTGSELATLISIAQLEEDKQIQMTDEYEVAPDFYKVLVGLALKRYRS